MEDKDVIGKTFIAFKFDDTHHPLRYNYQYEESFGKKAKVLNLHSSLPYANCRIKISSTTTIENYYPIQMIKDQLEEKEKEEAMSIEDIINQMKHLISKL